MSLTKIKVTTGPLEFEMQGAVMALKMPEGITIEIEKEGEDPVKVTGADAVKAFLDRDVGEYWEGRRKRQAPPPRERDDGVTGD